MRSSKASFKERSRHSMQRKSFHHRHFKHDPDNQKKSPLVGLENTDSFCRLVSILLLTLVCSANASVPVTGGSPRRPPGSLSLHHGQQSGRRRSSSRLTDPLRGELVKQHTFHFAYTSCIQVKVAEIEQLSALPGRM